MRSISKWCFFSLAMGFGWLACSSDPSEATFPLDGSAELLGGFSFDTGLKPSSGPVQLSLALSGEGKATAHAVGLAVDGDGGPVLYQVGEGSVAIEGGIKLDGRLVVDVPGVTQYDGDIPGLEDVRIVIAGESKFDAFAIEVPATAVAAIPETALPPIPLPGGVPGTLNLRVAAGSSLTVALTGTCAGIDGDTATFRASGVRSGTLVLGAEVAIKVPVVGEKKFDVGEISVPIPSGDVAFDATSAIGEVVDPIEGAAASPKACKSSNDGTGGAGGTGATTGGDATSNTQATTATANSAAVTVTSTGTGMIDCDATTDCGACQQCIFGEGGGCEFAYKACEVNDACFALSDCLNACPFDNPSTPIDEEQECLCGDPDAGYTCNDPSPSSCAGTYRSGLSAYQALGECAFAEPCYSGTCF